MKHLEKTFEFDLKLFTELQDYLTEYENLEYDWNGNYAEPFSPEVIKNSRDFLDLVKDYVEVISVFPTAIKAIQFEYEVNGIYCEIEIYSDHFETYTVVKNTKETEKYGFFGVENIKKAADKFLEGLRK